MALPLLLLHGALGTKKQFEPLVPALESHLDIHSLNFEGHGESGPTDSPFRISYFVENVLGYLDEHGLEQVNIFGYSMGGYVAMVLAKEYPQMVKKVATLGTILQWNEDIARRECRYLHPEKIKEKVPHFADKLKRQHPAGWERVVERTREMLQHLGAHPALTKGDWENFKKPVRFHVGDRDTTAGVDETHAIYNKIDKSELCVLPATAHPIEEVKHDILLASLLDFLREKGKIRDLPPITF